MALERILAIDVGAGTQDVLLWHADQPMENNVKLVLPSWTTILARQVKSATNDGVPVFLTGNLMGGGPVVSAMKRHMRAGFPVYVTPRAALTIRDNLDQVRERGYVIVEKPPDLPGTVTLHARDIDLAAFTAALEPFGVTVPETVAVAVQDHGECLDGSNRRFRFRLWREFVESGGDMLSLVYPEPPAHYTRMGAVQLDAPGAILMDTGSAALWGILEDEHAAARSDQGIIAVNVGNQHTLGVLLRSDRVLGLFEHHTVLMTTQKLARLINRLRAGTLTNDEVYADHGHGAFVSEDYVHGGEFDFVAVTGPQRGMARQLGYHFAAPHGDMMLTGCFGLVKGVQGLLGE